MTNYKFYLNNNGELCCIKTHCEKRIEFSSFDAERLLRKFDCCSFKHIEVTRRNMSFDTEYGKVDFINYKEIINEFGNSMLIQTLPKIHKFLRYSQRKKHETKSIRNLKIMGIKVAVGTLTMTSLISISHANEKKHGVFSSNENEMNAEIDYDNSIPLPDNVSLDYKEENIFDSSNTAGQDITHLDFSNDRYSSTGEYAYNTYYSIVDVCAKQRGISPSLVIALLTQESAGLDSNLMQIQFSSWEDQVLCSYDFSSNIEQKYVLTNHKEKYNGKDIICISKEDLKNSMTNISVGCILLMESFKSMNYHIGAGIQCYNLGVGNMRKVLAQTAFSTGVSIEDILSNQSNLDFMDYTGIVRCGDPEYLNHVLRYMENVEDGIDIKYVDEKGIVQMKNVTILPSNTFSK